MSNKDQQSLLKALEDKYNQIDWTVRESQDNSLQTSVPGFRPNVSVKYVDGSWTIVLSNTEAVELRNLLHLVESISYTSTDAGQMEYLATSSQRMLANVMRTLLPCVDPSESEKL